MSGIPLGSGISTSIIIVSYNGIAHLPACLGSLASQVDAGCEVIVVDNASCDGTPALLAQRYPWVRLCRLDENLGFAAACNTGAELARGAHLVFLNQDTRLLSGWLSDLLAPLRDGSGIGLVSAKALLMSRPGLVNTCGLEVHFTGLSAARGYGRPASEYARDEAISVVSGSCFAVRADTWRDLGGFDRRYFMYYEDTDLSWRAQLSGRTNFFASGSRFLHQHSSRPGASALYYSERNRWFTLLKNWRWVTLFLIAPSLFLAEVVQWGYCAVLGRDALAAKLRAAAWVVGHLPEIVKCRREIQSTRTAPDSFILAGRVWKLEPVDLPLNSLAGVLLRLVNALFMLNYRGCLVVLRAFNL